MYRTSVSLVLLWALVGCGGGGSDNPDLGSVTGTVTLDGKPLPNATVEFTPTGGEGGRPAVAVTDDDGEYELEYTPGNYGATPGSYQVVITTATTTTDAEGNDVDVPEKLPAKYNANTELKAEVKAGSNKFDFALDSKGEIANEEEDSDCC